MEFFAIGSDVAIGAATVTATTTWNSMGCIVDATPNTIARTFQEIRPCLNATSRKVKKKPHTVDYGSFAVTVRFDATLYATIKTKLEAGTTVAVAVKLGDTGQAKVATCYVENLGIPVLNEEGEVILTISFMIYDDDALIATPTIVAAS